MNNNGGVWRQDEYKRLHPELFDTVNSPEHEHKWVRDKNSALLITSPPQAWYECSICGARKTFFLNQEPKEASTDNDMVNNPEHYTQGGIECIDAIEAALTPEEFRGYLKGNCLKYLWRERMKGGAEDIAKAAWYIERLRSVDNE